MEKLNYMKVVVCVVLFMMMSPAAFATIVWSSYDDPYWIPYGTPDHHTITDGESAMAGSGSFMSDYDVVMLRVELLRASDGHLVSVVYEDEEILCQEGYWHGTYCEPDHLQMGFQSVEVTDRHYSGPGEYILRFRVSDDDHIRAKDLYLTVEDDGSSSGNTCPVLNTIGARTVVEGSLLRFTVSGSDSDSGDTLTYSASGLPAGAGFNSATRVFSWTPSLSQAGTYYVTFQVTDGECSDSERVRIVVEDYVPAVNHCPTLNPIGDREGREGELISFTVSGSDPDSGDTLTYSAIGLPPGAGFNSATRVFAWTPSASQAGTYYITFQVTDGECPDSERVRIDVSDDSFPGITFTASPNPTSEGRSVHFVCSATGDGPFTYEIDFGDGEAPAASGAADHVYVVEGAYDAECTATDRDGDVSTADVRVVVANDPPEVDLIVSPSSGEAPLTADLLCSVTDGNAPYNYDIDFGDGITETFTTATSSFSVTHTYLMSGSYLATCRVVDYDGDLGSDSQSVSVLPGGASNRCPVFDPMGDRTVRVGDTLTLTFHASDADGHVVTYHADGVFAGMVDEFTGVFSWTPASWHEGAHTLTVHAWDGHCDVAQSIDIDVLPEVPDNTCPVLSPLSDRTVRAGETLTFTAHASDADGDSIDFHADGMFAGMIDETTGVFTWTPAAFHEGAHTLTVHAWDGACDDSDSMTITVLPALPGNRCPVADFSWTPMVPDVGATAHFTSTSTDLDGDSLTCAWDFDEDGWVDSTSCSADWSFDSPGGNDVTLTVDDGECEDPVTHAVTVLGELSVESISCLSPIIESRPGDPRMGSCTVHVESTTGVNVGTARVNIYYLDGTPLASCTTAALTGSCAATFEAPSAGVYTVYANAEKPDWVPDLDMDPMATFEVLERRYLISDLAVYNEPTFTVEDYDFFRGEEMYVNFRVLDDTTLAPVDGMVTAVYLISPPGGVAEAVAFPHAYVPGNYWYSLEIPTNHDFLGDSHVFTFAFNFTDGSGESQVVEVVIRNNPPVIDPAVAGEFDRDFAVESFISLTPYESDVEDSGLGLRWHAEGVDPALFSVAIDPNDFMRVTPLAAGSDTVTLVLTDLDGDTDEFDVLLRSGVAPTPDCRDGIDNDGDGLVDFPADPGCASADDDDEWNAPAPECSDGIDNDGDGLVDFPADPGCSDASDDDEWNAAVPQCSDGIDNDGDHSVDWPDDFGCTGPDDNSEWNDGSTECSDGLDNDGDGLIDQYDPDCDSHDDDDESAQCSDGLDNDGDGLADAMDPGCYDSGVYNAHDDDETDTLPECSDHFDNDVDGRIDWPADPGCADDSDDDESDDPAPVPECSNGVDDDGDGLIDLFDPGCEDADDDSEWNFPTSPQCSDGVDNDFDGLIDYPADPGCTAAGDNDETDPVVPPECSDGVDNDGDGLVDFPADPGCTHPSDDDERDPVTLPQCSDGIDNDGDGLIDFPADPDCVDESDDFEAHIEECQDGLDNDGDGLVDWPVDPGCSNAMDDDETDIAGNQPPVADIDLSRTSGAPGMVVNIDGSDSYDPDGFIAEHYWYVFAPDGTLIYDAWDATAPGALDMTVFDEGWYEVRLIVVDDDGADDAEIANIHVSDSYAECSDGVDNDGDGFIDWPADPECASAEDDLEGDLVVRGPGRYFSDSDDLLITRLHIDGYDIEYAVVQPGEDIRVSVGLQNNLEYTLEDIRVETSVYELGLRQTGMLRELDPGESATVVLQMEVPYGAAPGVYDIRLAASNDDVRRVKYRTIAVV